jgi:hypothetical protein
MTLYETIVAAYPEIAGDGKIGPFGPIILQNDSDEAGDYIAKWDYVKPLPKGLKVGK